MGKDHQDTTTDEAKAREAVRQRLDAVEEKRENYEMLIDPILDDLPWFLKRQAD